MQPPFFGINNMRVVNGDKNYSGRGNRMTFSPIGRFSRVEPNSVNPE